MIFEKKSLHVIVPLDLAEGSRYTKRIHDHESDGDLDYIYKIIAREKDWVDPIVDGKVTWDHESSCNSDSDEELENW